MKYQILTNYTSLFAEVDLDEKISEEMKLKIIGDKENNIIKEYCPKSYDNNDYNSDSFEGSDEEYLSKNKCCAPKYSYKEHLVENCHDESLPVKITSENACSEAKMDNFIEKIEEIDLNKKEDLIKIINTQDFVDGFWDINEKTKIIKEKYEKEFELLNQLKVKKVDDKIIMTVLIIYFIYKEHPELLKELIMIINKGKNYIQEQTENTYDNIIKEIGIN